MEIERGGFRRRRFFYMSYSQAKSPHNDTPPKSNTAIVITREMAIHWAIVLALALAVVVTTLVLLYKCKRYWGHKWHQWREGGRKKRDDNDSGDDDDNANFGEEMVMRSPRMQKRFRK